MENDPETLKKVEVGEISAPLMNSHAKFRGTKRRGFPAVYEKSQGGTDFRPPSVRGFKLASAGGGQPPMSFFLKWPPHCCWTDRTETLHS